MGDEGTKSSVTSQKHEIPSQIESHDMSDLLCPDQLDTFTVHNPEVMPKEVQLQVFQRSFSTKGEAGRGIGTYSMKLFGERYLGGKVAFVSSSSEGTTFRLALLKKPLA